MIVVDGLGEELGLVLALAARAGLFADEKHLVHSHVQGVGLEGVDQLVHEAEDDGIDLGMQGTPASTVDPLVVRVLAGRLIELRVFGQQGGGALAP